MRTRWVCCSGFGSMHGFCFCHLLRTHVQMGSQPPAGPTEILLVSGDVYFLAVAMGICEVIEDEAGNFWETKRRYAIGWLCWMIGCLWWVARYISYKSERVCQGATLRLQALYIEYQKPAVKSNDSERNGIMGVVKISGCATWTEWLKQLGIWKSVSLWLWVITFLKKYGPIARFLKPYLSWTEINSSKDIKAAFNILRGSTKSNKRCLQPAGSKYGFWCANRLFQHLCQGAFH